MSALARIEVMRDGGAPHIVLEGEIDLAARGALEDAFGVALPGSCLVVDFTNVTFIDSTGIGAIARAVRANTAVSVVNPQPSVRRTLEISGIDRHVRIVESGDTEKT